MILTPGYKIRTDKYPVTLEEVLEFAGKYDPQPFHLSEEAAAAHPFFERLSASGWHTGAMVMRLTVDLWARVGGPLGAAGIDEIRWVRPVYPGDTLEAELEVLEVLEGKPRPGMRIAKVLTNAFNQKGELVMRHVASPIFPA